MHHAPPSEAADGRVAEVHHAATEAFVDHMGQACVAAGKNTVQRLAYGETVLR